MTTAVTIEAIISWAFVPAAIAILVYLYERRPRITARSDMTDQQLRELQLTGPVSGSRWKHRKGGTYRVVMIAVRESSLDLVVVYQGVESDVRWVRPLAEFMDGRFEEIE